MTSKTRRELVLAALASGGAALVPSFALARSSVVPTLALSNSFRRSNLAASKASHGAAFTFTDMVDAWGIAIRPAGTGGHFWVAAGGKSYQFVGDVTASATPSLRTLFQDCLAEINVPGADALTTADRIGKTTGTAFNGAVITSDLFRVSQQRRFKQVKRCASTAPRVSSLSPTPARIPAGRIARRTAAPCA